MLLPAQPADAAAAARVHRRAFTEDDHAQLGIELHQRRSFPTRKLQRARVPSAQAKQQRLQQRVTVIQR